MLNHHFKPLHKPSQSLVYDLTGATELGLCEFLEVISSFHDEECFRVLTTRRFQLNQQRGNFCDLQDWYVDEVLSEMLLEFQGSAPAFTPEELEDLLPPSRTQTLAPVFWPDPDPLFEPYLDPYYDARN